MDDDTISLLREKCRTLSIDPTPVSLIVSIARQALYLHDHDILSASFPVSTSANPPSCRANSFGTPWGLHRVIEKFGHNVPIGTVFKGRKSIGKTWLELPPEDNRANLITSRILRLEGLEPGLNRGPGIDSFARYIYVHGTNHEDRIGAPASGGCIQLRDTHMIELFERTPSGSILLILDPSAE